MEAVAADQVLPRAIELAAALADKDPATLGAIKRRLYAGALAALRDHDANSLTARTDWRRRAAMGRQTSSSSGSASAGGATRIPHGRFSCTGSSSTLQPRAFADQRPGGDVPLLDRALEVGVVAPGRRPRQIERRAAEAADVAHARDQPLEHLRLRARTSAS